MEISVCVCSSLWVCVCMYLCECSSVSCSMMMFAFRLRLWILGKQQIASFEYIEISESVAWSHSFLIYLTPGIYDWFIIHQQLRHLNGDAVLAANWADSRAPSGSLVGLVVEWADELLGAGNRSHHRQHSSEWSALPQVKYTTRSPWQWSHPWRLVSWPSSRCPFPQPWCH